MKIFLKALLTIFLLFSLISQSFAILSPEEMVSGLITNKINGATTTIKIPEDKSFEWVQSQLKELTVKSYNSPLVEEEIFNFNNLKRDYLLFQIAPIINKYDSKEDLILLSSKLKDGTLKYEDWDKSEKYLLTEYEIIKNNPESSSEVPVNLEETGSTTNPSSQEELEENGRKFLNMFFWTESPIFLKTKRNPEWVKLSSFEYALLEFSFNILFISMFVIWLLIVWNVSFWRKYNERVWWQGISWKYLRIKELFWLLIFVLFIFSWFLGTLFFTIYFDMLKQILDNLFWWYWDVIKIQ